ncbi:RIP metalloprotease RseP [Candidatus Sumerlaeota bacterium]|nr:RIP metalloprotease RseP [Candidatus Sumerlaeota bacterium]
MNGIYLLSSAVDFIGLGSVGNSLVGALGFIVAFGLAVFVHELGHFLAAKAFHVPVERFVIGMDKEAMGFLPRCIWERKLGETTYGISLVPLGGYVKMSGTIHPDIERYLDGGEAPKEGASPSLQEQALGDMAALYKKPFWQKFIIYAAGVFMNMVLAILVMTFIFTKGFEESAPFPARVGWIAPDSSLAGTDVKTGDVVHSMNGFTIKDSLDFMIATSILSEPQLIALQQLGRLNDLGIDLMPVGTNAPYTGTLAITLRRPNGEQYVHDIIVSDELDEGRLKWAKDLYVFGSPPAYIEFVNFNTPASKAGIEHGDTILSINGEKIIDWFHMRSIIRKSPRKELSVVVLRKGREVALTMTPWEDAEDKNIGQIGVVPGNPLKIVEKESFLKAVSKAPGRVFDHTVRYVSNLKRLGKRVTEGNVTAVRRDLGGPVGIAQIAYKMAQKSFDDWLRFVIGFNVALAVMNLIPFPVLDGGHIFFAAYEGIFRRPVPPRVLVPVMNGAVLFIIVFFVLVTFNDVLKLFS